MHFTFLYSDEVRAVFSFAGKISSKGKLKKGIDNVNNLDNNL